MTGLRLSVAGSSNEPSLVELYKRVRAEELRLEDGDPRTREQLLELQFKAQWASYHDEFPGADTRLISHQGSPVGWVIVDRTGNALHGIDIALLPPARSRGIGTHIIRQLQAEAAAAGRPMVITVNRLNHRAVALYARLGFAVHRRTDTHVLMEWHA
jgi:ribosomal protein S18 acetylase RimI-like enzyme